jgi:transcriptional regulator with XRE-family HTH domain
MSSDQFHRIGVNMKSTQKLNLDERRAAVREFRKEFKFSQTEFAAFADIGPSMLSRFENGERDLSPETLAKVEKAMARALGVRFKKLWNSGQSGEAFKDAIMNFAETTGPLFRNPGKPGKLPKGAKRLSPDEAFQILADMGKADEPQNETGSLVEMIKATNARVAVLERQVQELRSLMGEKKAE